MPYKRIPLAERLLSRIDVCGPVPKHVPCLGPCWLWTGTKDDRGYGRIGKGGHNGGQFLAHRVLYRLLGGELPDDKFGCHHCDNPGCVNPDHIFVSDWRGNSADMVAKGRSRKGDLAVFRVYPEKRPFGDANGSRKHPERLRRGESHPKAKLREADVREIKSLIAARTMTNLEIARRYKVSGQLISQIATGHIWKHVK